MPYRFVSMFVFNYYSSGCAYRLAKDIREHQQEDGADKVNDTYRDVEGIRLLVHVRRHDRNANQEDGLDEHESDSLCDSASLAESDEQALDQDVDQHRDDEEIRCRLELYVEEAPLVKRDWIRVEDVCWVLVHGDTAACKSDDFARCPA